MDTIAEHLRGMSNRVTVPRSVPGLVTQRLLVMEYVRGLPLMQLKDKVSHLPKWKRDKVGWDGVVGFACLPCQGLLWVWGFVIPGFMLWDVLCMCV